MSFQMFGHSSGSAQTTYPCSDTVPGSQGFLGGLWAQYGFSNNPQQKQNQKKQPEQNISTILDADFSGASEIQRLQNLLAMSIDELYIPESNQQPRSTEMVQKYKQSRSAYTPLMVQRRTKENYSKLSIKYLPSTQIISRPASTQAPGSAANLDPSEGSLGQDSSSHNESLRTSFSCSFFRVYSWSYIGKDKWVAVVSDKTTTKLCVVQLFEGDLNSGLEDGLDVLYETQIPLNHQGNYQVRAVRETPQQLPKIVLFECHGEEDNPVRVSLYRINKTNNSLILQGIKQLSTPHNRVYPVIFDINYNNELHFVVMGGLKDRQELDSEEDRTYDDYEIFALSSLRVPGSNRVRAMSQGQLDVGWIANGVVCREKYLFLGGNRNIYEVSVVDRELKIRTAGYKILKDSPEAAIINPKIMRDTHFRVYWETETQMHIQYLAFVGKQAQTKSVTLQKEARGLVSRVLSFFI